MADICGIIPINKPYGATSRTCVNKLTRALKFKKAGHCGTLDPNATGVMPILIGKATKLSDYLLDHEKEYTAGIKFGIMTSTLDIWSDTTAVSDKSVTQNDFINIIPNFIGRIEQIPPMYSAVKVNGQKLYKLARQGIEVDRKPRIITVYNIELCDFSFTEQTAVIKIKCSSGTYIRSLICDMAKSLNTLGIMSSLVRSSASGFYLDDCFELDEVVRNIENDILNGSDNYIQKYIIKPEHIFMNCSSLDINGFGERLLLNGHEILLKKYFQDKPVGKIRLYSDGRFCALGRVRQDEDGKYLKIENRFI